MHLIPILSLILPLAQVQAAIHDPCDAGGIPGICVTTSTCAVTDGTSRSGFCPSDPSDVKCCTTKCGPGAVGICRYNETCGSGVTLTGLCPGPNDFQCCLPEGTLFTSPLPPSPSGTNASSMSSTSPVSSFSPISTFSGVLNGSSFPLSSTTGRPTSNSQSESAPLSSSSSSVNTTTDGGDAAGSDPGSAGRTASLGTSLGLAMALVAIVAGL